MYCKNCGAEYKVGEKFCAKCGQAFATNTPANEGKATEVAKKSYGFFSTFSISDEELSSQVENHDVLPLSKSARGIAVLTIMALLAIGLVFVGALSLMSDDFQLGYLDVFLSVIFYAPFLYFAYRGHLWAIVGLGIYYTIDKLATVILLSPDHFNIGAIFFWIIGIGPIWVAFRVEREFRKKKMLNAAN